MGRAAWRGSRARDITDVKGWVRVAKQKGGKGSLKCIRRFVAQLRSGFETLVQTATGAGMIRRWSPFAEDDFAE